MRVVSPITTKKKLTRRGKVVVTNRQQYNLAQKMALIDLSRTDGIRTVSKKFGIHRSMIQRWIKKEESIRSLSIERGIDPYYRLRLQGPGRLPFLSNDVEERFIEWFNEKLSETRADNKCPTKVTIHMCVAAIRQMDATLIGVPQHLL